VLIVLMAVWVALCLWYYVARGVLKVFERFMRRKIALPLAILIGFSFTLVVCWGALVLIFNVFSRGPLVT
jgi:hypothetical protein